MATHSKKLPDRKVSFQTIAYIHNIDEASMEYFIQINSLDCLNDTRKYLIMIAIFQNASAVGARLICLAIYRESHKYEIWIIHGIHGVMSMYH